MKKTLFISLCLLVGLLFIQNRPGYGFNELGGACGENCLECHSITVPEAQQILENTYGVDIFLQGLEKTGLKITEQKDGSIILSSGDGRTQKFESKEDVVKTLDEIYSGWEFPLEVKDVGMGEVKGLWKVDYLSQGREGTLFIDFAKKNIIIGSVTAAKSSSDLSETKIAPIVKKSFDISSFPLEDALLMGSADAEHRVVVFDDPD